MSAARKIGPRSVLEAPASVSPILREAMRALVREHGALHSLEALARAIIIERNTKPDDEYCILTALVKDSLKVVRQYKE